MFTLLDTASGPTEIPNITKANFFYAPDMNIYDYNDEPVYVYSYNNAATSTKEYGMVYKNKLLRSRKFPMENPDDPARWITSTHVVNEKAGDMKSIGYCAAYGLTTVHETSKEIEES